MAFLCRYFDRRVPRYTSYPTALSFSGEVDAGRYETWLSQVPRNLHLSLYFHIPFCRSLCWFCGCHTKIVRRYDPVAAYLETLRREAALIARLLPDRLTVTHMHWGGGSPTMIQPDDWMRLDDTVRRHFRVVDDAEIGVEVDPRTVEDTHLTAFAATGVTRASLGVQDFDPEVQRAVNRIQTFATTARLIDRLRERGIDAISLDLMYGLPHQTVAGVAATAQRAASLRPGRIALFGYAHVPWMKRHQRLIPEEALPGAAQRWAQFSAAAARLREAGMVAVGFDHFAQPDDQLAIAAREGRLARNFQGYTTDRAPVLIGFGASAIGRLPQGYVQNAVAVAEWSAAIASGRPATARGVALEWEDLLRAEVIERLMCDLRVDLRAVCRRFGAEDHIFGQDIDRLRPLADEGLVAFDDGTVSVTEAGRPLLRLVAAAFDRRSQAAEVRHSRAV